MAITVSTVPSLNSVHEAVSRPYRREERSGGVIALRQLGPSCVSGQLRGWLMSLGSMSHRDFG
jgi:hypothetical protein